MFCSILAKLFLEPLPDHKKSIDILGAQIWLKLREEIAFVHVRTNRKGVFGMTLFASHIFFFIFQFFNLFLVTYRSNNFFQTPHVLRSPYLPSNLKLVKKQPSYRRSDRHIQCGIFIQMTQCMKCIKMPDCFNLLSNIES